MTWAECSLVSVHGLTDVIALYSDTILGFLNVQATPIVIVHQLKMVLPW